MTVSQGCKQRTISVAYPRHARRPEDLLHFVESTEFSRIWDRLGLDLEDDLTSLQLCIMANPKAHPAIKRGIRRHIHSFRDCGIDKDDVAAYYAYFEDFGIVLFICLDESASEFIFSDQQLREFDQLYRSALEWLHQRRVLK